VRRYNIVQKKSFVKINKELRKKDYILFIHDSIVVYIIIRLMV